MGGVSASTSNNTPWAPIQAPLQDIYTRAGNMANAGVGPQVFPGSKTAALSQPTQLAITGATEEATTGHNLGGAITGQYENMLGQGGMTSGMQGAYNTFQDVGGNNPYMEPMLDYQLGKAGDKVNSYFSNAGRYGSGAHTKALASELGGLRANTMYNQHNQDQRNRLSAASGMAGLGQGQAANLGAATGAASTLDDLRYSDFDRLSSVGANVQNYQQRLIDESVNKFDEQNMLPWNYLNLEQGVYQPGMAKFGKTQAKGASFDPMKLVGVPMALGGMK